MFGTSVFHAYVHEWACQIKFNPRFNKYWGLSDGEGLERLWSFLSALVSILCISTRLHRLLSIYWRTCFYKTKLNDGSGTFNFFNHTYICFHNWKIWSIHRYSTVASQTISKRIEGLERSSSDLEITIFHTQPGQTWPNLFPLISTRAVGIWARRVCKQRGSFAQAKIRAWPITLLARRVWRGIVSLLSLLTHLQLIYRPSLCILRSRVAHTAEQAISRLQESERLKDSISKQIEKVGTTYTSNDCQFAIRFCICLN